MVFGIGSLLFIWGSIHCGVKYHQKSSARQRNKNVWGGLVETGNDFDMGWDNAGFSDDKLEQWGGLGATGYSSHHVALDGTRVPEHGGTVPFRNAPGDDLKSAEVDCDAPTPTPKAAHRYC